MSASADTVAQPLDEQRAELGRLLGLDAPVTREVLLASLHDATYAHNLLTCRGEPALLAPLLARPPSPPARHVSEAEVVKSLAESMLRWGRAAFAYADDATYRARLAACGACEHRQAAGETLLHKLANLVVSNTAVCGLCQCLVEKKARAATERCPGAHPQRPGFNRWDQEMPA
ncbi:MAG TPA: hypothetical protein VGD01_16880 [Candidatus Elarobacter sp.]|jgi:hypothetical protein